MGHKLDEMLDITALIRDAASSLPSAPPLSNPGACMVHSKNFCLLDSMSALELMDEKMDISSSSADAEEDEKLDAIDSNPLQLLHSRILPFYPPELDDLSLDMQPPQLTAKLVKNLSLNLFLLYERSLSGATIVETILTCGYYCEGVIGALAEACGLVSVCKTASDGSTEEPPTPKTTETQRYLLATLLTTLRLVGLTKLLVYHGDIYEEEDYSPLAGGSVDYCLGCDLLMSGSTGSDDSSVFGQLTSKMVDDIVNAFVTDTFNTIDSSSGNDLQTIKHVVEFNVKLYDLCKTLSIGTQEEVDFSASRAAAIEESNDVEKISSAHVRHRAVVSRAKITSLLDTLRQLKALIENGEAYEPVPSPIVSTNISRKLQGSAPSRTVVPLTPLAAVDFFTTLTLNFKPIITSVLHSNLSQDLTRNLRMFSALKGNVLNRSVMATLIYFNDRVLGQYPLFDYIGKSLATGGGVPRIMMEQGYLTQLIQMMGVPMFESWKIFLWNRTRQRYMIEKKIVPDWVKLQEEATIADHLFREQFGLSNEPNAVAYMGNYCMQKMLTYMEHYLSLGLETKVAFGLDCANTMDLSYSYWYYDYVISTLLNVLDATVSKREAVKNDVHRSVEEERIAKEKREYQEKKKQKSAGSKKSKGKKPKPPSEQIQPREVSGDEKVMLWRESFDRNLISIKQAMTRGIFRLHAALRKANFTTPPELSSRDFTSPFTSEATIFSARFAAFKPIKHPPFLNHEKFLEINNTDNIAVGDLLKSSVQEFNKAKKELVALCDEIDLDEERSVIMKIQDLEKMKEVCVKNALTALSVNQIIKKEEEVTGAYELSLSFVVDPVFAVVNVAPKEKK